MTSAISRDSVELECRVRLPPPRVSRSLGIVRLSLSLSLLLIPACDPEYSLCVVATSCVNDLPLPEAHVRIRAYDVDGNGDSVGRICKHQLNFPDPFKIEVDAPGYFAKTDGPFQFDKTGTTDFQATVCLNPQP
jgi:hypothetical protein